MTIQSSLIASGGGIKSIQTGSMDSAIYSAGPINVTITSVDTTKSVVMTTDRVVGKNVTAYLTSSTNLKFESESGGVTPALVRWYVVEYK